MSEKEENYVVTTVKIPRAVWGRIKALATERDCKLQDIVRELLTNAVSKEETQARGCRGEDPKAGSC